jgi:hypothetical protein
MYRPREQNDPLQVGIHQSLLRKQHFAPAENAKTLLKTIFIFDEYPTERYEQNIEHKPVTKESDNQVTDFAIHYIFL